MRTFAAALLLAAATLSVAAAEPPAKQPPPDVVLVTLDTFRADRLAPWGGAPTLAPALNGLAARGRVYTTCFTPSPVTLPAHAALLTGCYPPKTGLLDNGVGRLSPKAPALAEAFAAAGYKTAAVISAAVLDGRYGLDRGFQLYDDSVGPAGLRDASEVTDRALRFLSSGSGPRFLWAHYFNTHEPYLAPEEYVGRAATPYDRAVAYTDTQVGRLLAGLPQGTLVVVVSDHGEGLGDHGEPTHGMTLYQASVQALFLLAGPGVEAGKDPRPCSLADVAPTLARLAGLKALSGAEGVDLGSKAADGPRRLPLMTLLPFTNYRWSPVTGATDGTFKWVRAGAVERLFDLGADPGEARDLAKAPPAAAKALRGAVPAVPKGGSASAVDPALRGLGYVGAPGGDPGAAGRPDPHGQLVLLDKMRQGQTLRTRGDLAGAEALYAEVVAADPGNPAALFDLGETQRRRGRLEPAVQSLDRALKASPALPEAWIAKGHALVGLEKRDEAASCYHRALELDPEAVDALNPLAAYYLDKNEPAQAFPLLDRAESSGVADTQTYLMLGRIHLIQGKDEEARKDFFSALQYTDDPPATLKAQADAYMMRERYEQGVGLYAEGIRRFPDYAPNYLTLGTWYLQVEKPERALELFRKALGCPLDEAERNNVQEIVAELQKAMEAPAP